MGCRLQPSPLVNLESLLPRFRGWVGVPAGAGRQGAQDGSGEGVRSRGPDQPPLPTAPLVPQARGPRGRAGSAAVLGGVDVPLRAPPCPRSQHRGRGLSASKPLCSADRNCTWRRLWGGAACPPGSSGVSREDRRLTGQLGLYERCPPAPNARAPVNARAAACPSALQGRREAARLPGVRVEASDFQLSSKWGAGPDPEDGTAPAWGQDWHGGGRRQHLLWRTSRTLLPSPEVRLPLASARPPSWGSRGCGGGGTPDGSPQAPLCPPPPTPTGLAQATPGGQTDQG